MSRCMSGRPLRKTARGGALERADATVGPVGRTLHVDDPKTRSAPVPADAAPAWLDAPRAAGRFERVATRALGRHLDVLVWSPCRGPLPLLVAHDGPEYDQRSSLTHYAGAMIESGALPP